jgi:hypothetical protein
MRTIEEVRAALDALDFKRYMAKLTDNAYAISGRMAEDEKEFWRLKKELDTFAD